MQDPFKQSFTLGDTDVEISIDALVALAKQAGSAILEFYTDDMDVETKADNSPLTKADLASHEVIMKGLQQMTPEIPIISEEGGLADYEERKDWKQFWIVDPLDGTKEFIKRNGEFTVNIALVADGDPVLGVVYIPAQEITYLGASGLGSFKQENEDQPERIISRLADKSQPLKVMCSRSHKSDSLSEQLAEKGLQVGETVPAGSSLKFCLVADGTADIYPRMGPTMEWDVAAGDAVYRYSAEQGAHPSPLQYNKEDLLNSGFMIGI
ncbi:MAG: 3'(2'),5'-bisphosphate nucleotidase CysQ [Bacteroidota bacterium]